MNNDEIIDLDKFNGNLFDDFTKDIPENKPEKSRKTKRTIPVIILTGFLGSGKTTLLNHILKNSPNMRIGAIVNDFGKINIDNMLVAGNVSEKTIELSNGCICCMLGDNGLKEPLAQLANSESKIDAIIIEASGIAEPYDLMQTLRFARNEFVHFGGNIYITDAQHFNDNFKQFSTYFTKCLKTSDIILINKTDLVSQNQLKKINEIIRELNPHSPVINTSNAEISTELLFDNNLIENPQTDLFVSKKEPEENHEEHQHRHGEHSHHDHLHHQFQTISFSEDKPLDPKKFINFLDNLPQNLFRAKGFCYFGLKGYEQKYLLQIVGKYITISAEEWAEGEKPATNLVLIGHELDEKSALSSLKKLIDSSPEDFQPDSMMNFERFFIK